MNINFPIPREKYNILIIQKKNFVFIHFFNTPETKESFILFIIRNITFLGCLKKEIFCFITEWCQNVLVLHCRINFSPSFSLNIDNVDYYSSSSQTFPIHQYSLGIPGTLYFLQTCSSISFLFVWYLLQVLILFPNPQCFLWFIIRCCSTLK